MNERAGEAELLFHPARQLPGAPLAKRRHARGGEQPRRALVAGAPVDAEQLGEELDVLVDRQILVEPEALRHVADVRARNLGFATTSTPSIAIDPSSGVITAASRRMIVVFPAPSGPTKPNTSPLAQSR